MTFLMRFVQRFSAMFLQSTAVMAGLGGRTRLWDKVAYDAAKMESPNAGWPMAAMAGALEIELTKQGHYSLGNAKHSISHNDIVNSVKSLYSSSVIFVLIISVISVSRVY